MAGKQKNGRVLRRVHARVLAFILVYPGLPVQNGIVVMQSNGKEMYKNV